MRTIAVRVALGLTLAAPVLGPAAAGSAPACAAAASHAALVVTTGARTYTYCVGLDASSVSGIHLIQLAGSQFGLQYTLGFGGQAVCQLAGVGVSGGDCFGAYPDFWGYWHGDGAGGWTWAGSGAATASIESGDVEGWVWGSGDSGTTHAAPPASSFDEICHVSTPPSPSPTPSPGGGGGPGGGSGGGGSRGAGGGAILPKQSTVPATSTPSGSPHRDGGHPDRDRSSSSAVSTSGSSAVATAVTELAAGVTDDSGGGAPPTGVIFALLAIVALGGAGWFLRRRGSTSGGG